MRKSKRAPKFTGPIKWHLAQDIRQRIDYLTSSLNLDWIKTQEVYCFRSENSKSRAVARIWGLPRVWQQALNREAAYILEVLSEKFDELGEKEKDEVLLHELAHIPKNFSGALLPHTRRKKGSFEDKLKLMITAYKKEVLSEKLER